MKNCSNCRFSQIGFSLYSCALQSRKMSAFDSCDRWMEKKQLDGSNNKNVEFLDSLIQICQNCEQIDSYCICWNQPTD